MHLEPPKRRRRLRDRRGVMAVFFSVFLIVIMGMVAFAVDVGYLGNARGQLRAAADASALAAAGEMAHTTNLASVRSVAINFAQLNVPASYGEVLTQSNVTFGIWDANTSTFTPADYEPNAVRVVVERTQERGNAIPFFFGRVLGQQSADISVEAIAVGAVPNQSANFAAPHSVYVTSTKDLSNVVLEFEDGTHQKFDSLQGYSATFQGTGVNTGKVVVGVWIKSGCNHSDDGPGYGERLLNPGDGTTVHGAPAQGCKAHVTATFQATGPEFLESGALSPVRLVK